MIYAKDVTYGLDRIIKIIQTELSNGLEWLGTFDVYGKIQPTERDGKLIPECYVSGVDYKDVFNDDRKSAIIGFDLISRTIDKNKVNATLDVIFTVDLTKIYGNVLRDDERSVKEAKEVLYRSKMVNSVNGIKTGIKDVFSRYDQSKIKHRDMQPFFVFSININCNYYDNDGNCNAN